MMQLTEKIGRPLGDLAKALPLIGDRFTKDRRRFIRERASFYNDLSETMEAMPSINISVHIERIADRYPGEPKGRLAARWLENYRLEASFADAIRDSVPSEDYAPLMVAEKHGNLAKGLKELSEVTAALDATKEAIAVIWFTLIFAFIAAQIFVGFYSFSIIPEIERGLPANVPVETLGTAAIVMHWMSFLVRHFWPLWIAFILAFIGLVIWSVPNYIGKYREWMDRHILHYKLYAEFQAVSFFVTLSAVTERINNRVISVPNALRLIQASSTVWLSHHIRRILANYEENPHAKGENFKVGMVDRHVEFRMQDIADYADVSQMLRIVAKNSLAKSPKEMERRALRIQLWSRILLVAVVIGIQAGFYSMGWQFQDAVSMSTYMPTR